jgi:SAM-dependent methyltransferase
LTPRREFLRKLSTVEFERASPAVAEHFLSLFNDDAIDWQDLARPAASLLASNHHEPLLNAYLRRCVNTSWVLEQQLITRRRRALVTRKPDFALAVQAFLNRYIWPVTREEYELLLASADPRLGLMYERPLDPKQIEDRQLHELLIDHPEEERRLVAALTGQNSRNDDVSVAVRLHYEDHPYPHWLSFTRPDQSSDQTPKTALVAGCGTGRDAILLALRQPTWTIDAIDVSRQSLGFAMRNARRLGIPNLSFQLQDLRDVSAQYDVIECIGVLHHLSDPLEGLIALRKCLAPGGELRLGLYSRRGRAALAHLRTLAGDPSDLRAARTRIFSAMSAEERRAIEDLDFFETAHFVDTLFHVHESEYTPSELSRLLERAGLRCDEDLVAWETIEQTNPSAFRNMYRCRVTIAA